MSTGDFSNGVTSGEVIVCSCRCVAISCIDLIIIPAEIVFKLSRHLITSPPGYQTLFAHFADVEFYSLKTTRIFSYFMGSKAICGDSFYYQHH